MSVSDVDICNLALSRFGQGNINSLDEASAEAFQCNINYARARDAVLREFPWQFALMPVILAPVSYTASGWNYAYAYPTNALAIRRVFDPNDARNTTKPPYRVVTDGTYRYIVCDVNNANADITFAITDPNMFDSQFVEALSYKLAAEIVIPLSASGQRKQELYQEYVKILNSAQLASATEDNWRPDVTKSASYIGSRR